MSGPYTIQYKKSSIERHRFMGRMKGALVSALIVGFTVLLFNGFSANPPLPKNSAVPMNGIPDHRGRAASAPVWLREYDHDTVFKGEQLSAVGKTIQATVDTSEDAKDVAELRRLTPIHADRKALEKALRLAGE